jgi:hypothetical protein
VVGPRGSKGLTEEVWQTIIAFIRAGGYDHVAAESAGISERTFRDWMARGEGRHTSRGSSARLRAFAEEVTKAKAQARLAAETQVAQKDPKYWLSRAGRTRPGREGWTDPAKEARGGMLSGLALELGSFSDEELERIIASLDQARDEELRRRNEPGPSSSKGGEPWRR